VLKLPLIRDNKPVNDEFDYSLNSLELTSENDWFIKFQSVLRSRCPVSLMCVIMVEGLAGITGEVSSSCHMGMRPSKGREKDVVVGFTEPFKSPQSVQS